MTSDLIRRVYEHKQKIVKGFTAKHDVNKLGYFEEHQDIVSAITREKVIKGGSRRAKIELIENKNPNWDDLYEKIM